MSSKQGARTKNRLRVQVEWRKIGERFLQGAFLIVFAFSALFISRLLTLPVTADAASSIFHPSICLGGWRNAMLASGEPTLSLNAAPEEFTSSNSALLESNVSTQLFCAGFPTPTYEHQPYSVTVSFLWTVAPGEVNLPEEPETSGLEGTTIEEITPAADEVVVPALVPQEEVAPQEPEQIEPVVSEPPPPEEGVPSQPIPEEVPLDTNNEPSLEPQSDPEISPEAPQSAIKRAVHALFSVPKAYAQELSGSSNFFSISYTFDGVEWVPAGVVDRGNWRNFSFSIPGPSWEQLGKLQIKVETVPSTDDRPAVFIESVMLRVQTSPTITEMMGDQVEAVGDVAANVLDAVDGLAALTLELLTPSDEPEPSAPPPPPPPVERKEQKLAFRERGDMIMIDRMLPWYDDAFKKEVMNSGAESLTAPFISISDDGLSMNVRGFCTKPYFVVLTFRNSKDYKDNPKTFASNYAGRCENGSFTYDMKALPLDTADGMYYLLLGEQGETGPWIPTSHLQPIEISHKEIITIEQP